MDKYLRRIVIETDNESAPSPDLESDYEDIDIEYLSFESKYNSSRIRKVVTISNIDLSYWTVKMEYEYSERFKKVADIVGDNLAARVLSALDGKT